MVHIGIDQLGEVTQDIPERELHCGDVGIVCSMWFAPSTVYEVEFQPNPHSCCLRTVLLRNQIQADTKMHDGLSAGERT